MKKTKEASKKHAPIQLPEGPIPPAPDPAPPIPDKPGPCDALRSELESWLSSQKDLKEFQLEPCDEGHEEEDCACGGHGGSGKPKVDLIILIDTSGSMTGAAKEVVDAAESALKEVQAKCPTDLRLVYLGVDATQSGYSAMPGGFPGVFAETHEHYLAVTMSPPYTGPFAHDAAPPVSFPGEQGANAIEDLSKHFDWRKDACRAIFYISDTTLDADWSQIPQDTLATQNAIAAAIANNVVVSAHFIGTATNDFANTALDYSNLCTQTGGILIHDTNSSDGSNYSKPSTALYVPALTNAICNACGEKCKTVEFPDIQPCISVSWGDGDCDCLETDDYEVLYITVCNCFNNVSFANFSIAQLLVTNADGTPVAILPDGTDSVEVRPRGPICFGNIGPCVDGKPSCKSREFVLYTRGAKQGKYKLKFEGICFDIVYGASTERCFEFDLCYS